MAARWVVVVPIKATAAAKSRLVGVPVERASLARAFALDTVSAVLGCSHVRRAVVVTDDADLAVAIKALGGDVLRRSLPLNAAVAEAAGAETGPVATLPADLPALTPDTLAGALTSAEGHPRAVVADRRGEGTVLLSALDARALAPHFGGLSFLAHQRAGATPLTGASWPDLRCDVDTAEDLAVAVALGVGRHTSAALRR